MESVVKTGRTVDEAIDSALQEMGLTRDEVQVDILQLENSGFLGLFGRKEGKVRVTPMKSLPLSESTSERKGKPKQKSKPRGERAEKASTNNRETRGKNGSRKSENNRPERKPDTSEKKKRQPEPTTAPSVAQRGESSAKAEEVVRKISETFGIKVDVQATETEKAVNIRVVGDQVGQLIGRRGRTLGAVQYIVSRLINEDRPDRKKITIDVDGYNEDRESSLKELATRTADRVMETGKPVFLRPMSPPERRIIHLTLQDDDEVGTESVGEQDSRQVVLFPKSIDQEELQRILDSPPPPRSGRRPPRRRRRN
ncbi:MAG: Jag N-terminal domain-containing protein [Candidatus Omnitrophica bacterium]|nr:Jag N-terminal domain-containing protein [Candidatus Omnitrophota bacterium]